MARKLVVRPLTPERWPDVESLFGERGACGGCWCMYWRVPQAAFVAAKGDGNRRAFRSLVKRGAEPGLVAYDGKTPVAWCALAPREQYPRLGRSRTLAPIDGEPVWSVTCFFVAKPYRRSGVTVRLLEAAIDHVRRRGGRILEGYPVDTGAGGLPDAFVYTGLPPAFKKAGFLEVARRSRTRPVFRFTTGKN